MKIKVQSEYTAAACTRAPAVVDWSPGGVVCYCAANAVLLYDTTITGKDPITVLCHHKDRVNSVKWLISTNMTSSELLSCSKDKTALIWSKVDGIWRNHSLIGHTEAVTCVDGVYLDGEMFVYTASVDSTIKIWQRTKDETSCIQTISLGSGLCLALRTYLLPGLDKPILLCALDDHKIHIFAPGGIYESEYQRLHVLTGHEDWVRGLDVMKVDNNALLIASCSQDTFIRLWRVQRHEASKPTANIKTEEKLFRAYDQDWSVTLDAVLQGHEGWVYGVQWHPPKFDTKTKSFTPVYRLLSSSLDKTVIIWEPIPRKERGDAQDSGAWVESVRVGEVGGNGLGFYGSRFGPNGKSFLGHGYNGSFHMWKHDEELQQWRPCVVCGGHFSEVCDVRWERAGLYVASVSTDQTTRLHAVWHGDGRDEWHEIARPQVHGYDMSSIALVSPTTFVSSAEEKVIRVFEAPLNFVNNFKNITGKQLVADSYCTNGPEGASVPSLGLSNKAVFGGDNGPDPADKDADRYFVPVHLDEPPTEETLMQNTLWPESHKLYGHGYEVFCLDAARDGSLVASACKATSQEHAALILWETKSWQQIQKLVSHQLTVTQIAFSPDSRQLVSVSRDRKWTLYQREQGGNLFNMVATTDKTNGLHTRIIWCCAWTHDSVAFGTGSRDGKVCVWSKSESVSDTSLRQHSLLGAPLQVANLSVTALAFAPSVYQGHRTVAVGSDSGCIRLYSFVPSLDDCWSFKVELDNSCAHHLTVRKLEFAPHQEHDDHTRYRHKLVSCGGDHLVRIYSVDIVS